MAQHTFIENVHRNTEDWLSTKAAVRAKGVDCPDSTPTAQVAGKIEDISTYEAEKDFLYNIQSLGERPTTFTIPPNYTKLYCLRIIKDGGTGDAYLNSLGGLSSIEIPSTLQEIGYKAFSNSSLTSIYLPPTILSVGLYAFYQSMNLAEINVQCNISAGINEWAAQTYFFGDCGWSAGQNDKIEKVIWGSNNKIIPQYCFSQSPMKTLVIQATDFTNIFRNGLSSVNEIYFAGTQTQWESVIIDSSVNLSQTTMHYEYSGDGSEL